MHKVRTKLKSCLSKMAINGLKDNNVSYGILIYPGTSAKETSTGESCLQNFQVLVCGNVTSMGTVSVHYLI